jgi:uncharacterized protein (TIGR02444 family)
MSSQAEQLWDFAVALYEREPVKAACLRVQARYGLSISLLLGAIWTGREGLGRLGTSELEHTIRRALEWHRDIIEPIRALRRGLRQHPPAGVEEATHELRRQLVESELGAERIEQNMLLQDFPTGLPVSPENARWRDAAINSALLMRKSCPRPEPEALDALALILHAACPDAPYGELYQEIESAWGVS